MEDHDGPMSWDLDSLVAIDTHVHVEQDSHGCCSIDQELMDASAAYFKGNDNRTPTVGDLATYYRERRIGAVVFTVDSTTAMGHPALSSEEIIDLVAEHDDILIPFASVDPLADDAPARVRSLVAHGAQGFKFHPSLQQFEPNDVRYYPIYEAIAEAGLPTVFHTGQTGIGAGLPGGRGIKLRYSDPMLLDDVAADFPTLTVILAHPSVPWQDSAISMATHKANVYIDLSGWLPEVLPAAARAGRQQPAARQGAVRLRLPRAVTRSLDRQLRRRPRHQARGAAADHEGQRDPRARPRLSGPPVAPAHSSRPASSSTRACSSGSTSAVSRNARTHSTAMSGESRRELSARTLASFHRRAFRAVHASEAWAARTPRTLFAAIAVPVPVQHITTPYATSPVATMVPSR